ncbi:MAG: hypothetical protein WBW14_23000 [Candidatus Acidiferrum sp.]
MEGTKRTAGRQNSPTKADHDIRLGRQVESHPNPTARPIAAALSNEVIEIEVMKKPRELYETELAAIREELLRLGARPRESLTKLAISVRSEEQVTPPAMMMAAYELAGYAVATRALGRSLPDKVALKGDSEYDLGRCSEPELGTIWAVGHMAAERIRDYGCFGEQGLIGISVRMESSIADGMELNHREAEVIVDENWDTIVHVARLLIERGILSRSELENAIFDPSMEREKSAKQSAAIQTEPLENWQQARRRWLDRMQSEMALWAELGSKLATTRSAREAFDAYATCAAQQMKMIAEDGQRLLKDFQCVTQKVIQSVKKEVAQRIVR